MRSIFLIAAVIIFLPCTVWAVPTAGITVPKAGDYCCWFEYADIKGERVVTVPVCFKDKKTTVDLPLVKDAVPESCELYVLDAKTGNEAVVSVEGKPGEVLELDLKPSDFSRVRRVRIVVTSASTGQPAAAAIVKLESGEDVQVQVIDPSSGGAVQFADVHSGAAKVTVEYGDGKTTSQDIDIPLDRDSIVAALQVPVVGEIETIQAAEGAGAGKESPGGEAGRPSEGFNFPVALVGLILLIAVLYAAVRLMRSRGLAARQLLEKMGVELPEEPGAAQPAPAPEVEPGVCPFCGGKKDPATGTCACSIGQAPGPGAAAPSGPRLIVTQGTYAGSIYALEAGVVTIGREESNMIALPEDNAISRRHARITSEGGEFTVHDEGSSNGTFVNGVKVTEQALKSGDEVQIGNTRMRYEV